MLRRPTKAWIGTLIAFVLVDEGRAVAGNEDEMLVGNDAALMGGAVAAVVRDGASVWYNPGGLGGSERDRLDMTATVYSLRISRAPGFLRSAQGDTRTASVNEFVAVPSQISYVRTLGERATLGLAYYAPRAANLIVRESLRTSAGNITSDWSVDGFLSYKEYVFGAALGIEPVAGLRFGGGLLLRWESLTQSEDFFGVVASDSTAVRTLGTSSLFTHDQVGIEPIVGVQWEVTQNLALAVNARGPRLGVYNAGEETRSDSIAIGEGTQLLLAQSVSQKLDGKALTLARLGRYFVGAAYRFGATLVSVDGDLQPGLVNLDAGIDRKMAWNLRVGATRRLSEKLMLGAGLFTDRGADRRNEEGLLSGGADFWGGTLGVAFDDRHHLAPGEPVDSLRFSTLFALRYAYARSKLTNLTVDPITADPLAILTLGETDITVHEIGLYVGAGLYF